MCLWQTRHFYLRNVFQMYDWTFSHLKNLNFLTKKQVLPLKLLQLILLHWKLYIHLSLSMLNFHALVKSIDTFHPRDKITKYSKTSKMFINQIEFRKPKQLCKFIKRWFVKDIFYTAGFSHIAQIADDTIHTSFLCMYCFKAPTQIYANPCMEKCAWRVHT